MRVSAFCAIFVILLFASLGLCNKSPPPICFNEGGPGDAFEALLVANRLARIDFPQRCNGQECVVVDCIGNTNVILCNDSYDTIKLSTKYLATYVYDIIGKYTGNGGTLKGQLFDTDKYNVLVHRSYHCPISPSHASGDFTTDDTNLHDTVGAISHEDG